MVLCRYVHNANSIYYIAVGDCSIYLCLCVLFSDANVLFQVIHIKDD